MLNDYCCKLNIDPLFMTWDLTVHQLLLRMNHIYPQNIYVSWNDGFI